MANKTKLFDRVFKPEHIVLDNGHTIDRPKSKMPLIFAGVFVVVFASVQLTGFDLGIVISRIGQLWAILGKIFHPDFSFFPQVIQPLIDTIQMSLLGSIIGCVLALPVSIISSSNIIKNSLLSGLLVSFLV